MNRKLRVTALALVGLLLIIGFIRLQPQSDFPSNEPGKEIEFVIADGELGSSIATNLENWSFEFLAILMPSQKSKIKMPIIAMHPIAPISSPITAKIESVIASGKNPNFCVDIPSPLPKTPPDPKEIKD